MALDDEKKPTTEKTPTDFSALTKLSELYWEHSEFAEFMGVTTRTLNNWQSARRGPPTTKIGQKIYYRKTSALQWLVDREKPQPPTHARARRRSS
jgi:hypothetical protein